MEIRPIQRPGEVGAYARLIRESFATVAERFGLTAANAPTHPSLLTEESLSRHLDAGLDLFGLYDDDERIGCVGVEEASSGGGAFYVERLAVLPDRRGTGCGRALLDFAVAEIAGRGGRKIGIAIVDEDDGLKAWYVGYGFRVTGSKRFPALPFTVCFLELIPPEPRAPGEA